MRIGYEAKRAFKNLTGAFKGAEADEAGKSKKK